MIKTLAFATSIATLFLCMRPQPASARKALFGREEQIHCIQERTVENYDLCRKVSLYFFIAGVWVTKDGYVLQEASDRTKYIPLDKDKIQMLQREEYLPTPLPQYSIPITSYLFGYSLWIILFITYTLIFIVSLNSKMKQQSETDLSQK